MSCIKLDAKKAKMGRPNNHRKTWKFRANIYGSLNPYINRTISKYHIPLNKFLQWFMPIL